jgi:PAS domain S-box-containing protein
MAKTLEIPGLKIDKSKSRESLLLDLIPFVLYTAGLGPNYKVFWITENVQRLTGFSARHFIDDPDLWISRIHPDDRELTLKNIEQLSSSFPKSTEYRWRCADGKYQWFLDTLDFLRDDKGRPIELIGCWFNITKRKSYEESMRKLSSIVESSDDAIISLTLGGIIVSWNSSAEKIYGYSAHEMIGQSIDDLLLPERRQEFDELVKKVAQGAAVHHQESKHRTKEGNLIDLSLTISPVRDVANKIAGVSIIMRNVTESKRLERELTQTTRRYTEDLQRLTRTLQHAQEEERRRISRELHDDLNQRLSNLKLNIEMLAGKKPRGSGIIARHLQDYAQQLDKLIRDVHTIAYGLRPAILDDFGLVISLQLLCRDFEKLHHCKTSFHMCECVPNLFKADVQIAFYRIAQESFFNIAKHSAATHVRVKLLCDESLFKMIIEDNGRGFELDEFLSREPSRRGLGLVGMTERAEMIGGKFHLESKSGTGTTIEVHIPLSACTRSK